MELQTNLDKLGKEGVALAAISYDSVEILDRFTKKSKIEFPLLSDAGSKIIDAFHLRNEENASGIPHPGIMLMDRKGIIRAKLFYEGYRTRHTSQDVVDAVKLLKAQSNGSDSPDPPSNN